MTDNSTDSEVQATDKGHADSGESGTGSGTDVAYGGTAACSAPQSQTDHLMEKIVHRDNLNEAYRRVVSNKGAAGVDGMSVHELLDWCRKNRNALIGSLLEGTYTPSPVRGVEIPKADGGKRQLGIPTAVDRLVQQAFLQALTPVLDPLFSEASFGFRPGRSAHGALKLASKYVTEGYVYVVDMDLEKFFDRVNHDILMARLARHVKDKRVLKVVRAFLTAGIMKDGVVQPRDEGTPQGGPLSPLLANLLLDDLDRELQRRGHRFVRYADDCNIYAASQRSGERVFESVTAFLDKKLKLKVNREKSAVGLVNERSFLGYRLFPGWQPGAAEEDNQPF